MRLFESLFESLALIGPHIRPNDSERGTEQTADFMRLVETHGLVPGLSPPLEIAIYADIYAKHFQLRNSPPFVRGKTHALDHRGSPAERSAPMAKGRCDFRDLLPGHST
jgi:hypothetical protein